MNILFISENFPYPLDSGGRIRTYHILKGLSQEHDVTLVTTADSDRKLRDVPELEKVCRNVSVVSTSPETSAQLGLKLLKNLVSPVPIVVERHYVPAVAQEITRLCAATEFDVVHFDHLDASIYARHIPASVRTVLDEHNIVTNQVKTSIAAEPNRLKGLYMQSQLGKTRRYEAATCPTMTRCLVCSDRDKEYLLDMAPATRISTIPNGVDVEYFQQTSQFREESGRDAPPAMIFVGMLDYGPGGVGGRYFCKEILPLIQEAILDVKFYAVGQNPPRYLQALAEQNPNVVLTGRVDDIRPYVAKAQVFVVPLQSGSGTRLKILDAMSMGIPVVSTSIGAEGLDVQSGEHLIIADTPHTFSEAVVQLLRDSQLGERMCANAFELVQAHYSWQRVWERLLKSYTNMMHDSIEG